MEDLNITTNAIGSDGLSSFGGSLDGGTVTTFDNSWGDPIRIDVIEHQDRIEFVYKEISSITYTSYPSPPPEERVFKIVFSCKDGEWHESERIYGEIVPAKQETYQFDD